MLHLHHTALVQCELSLLLPQVLPHVVLHLTRLQHEPALLPVLPHVPLLQHVTLRQVNNNNNINNNNHNKSRKSAQLLPGIHSFMVYPSIHPSLHLFIHLFSRGDGRINGQSSSSGDIPCTAYTTQVYSHYQQCEKHELCTYFHTHVPWEVLP